MAKAPLSTLNHRLTLLAFSPRHVFQIDCFSYHVDAFCDFLQGDVTFFSESDDARRCSSSVLVHAGSVAVSQYGPSGEAIALIASAFSSEVLVIEIDTAVGVKARAAVVTAGPIAAASASSSSSSSATAKTMSTPNGVRRVGAPVGGGGGGGGGGSGSAAVAAAAAAAGMDDEYASSVAGVEGASVDDVITMLSHAPLLDDSPLHSVLQLKVCFVVRVCVYVCVRLSLSFSLSLSLYLSLSLSFSFFLSFSPASAIQKDSIFPFLQQGRNQKAHDRIGPRQGCCHSQETRLYR